ncbi:MAG: hypothetical protein NT133_25440 [Alphaproteobacteria bacterium]|nr:hypothetical protein [Alphaproteobacteria bacterium]
MNKSAPPPDLPQAAGIAARLVRVLLGLLGTFGRGVAWLLRRREELAFWDYVEGVLRDFTDLLDRIAAGELQPVERVHDPRRRKPRLIDVPRRAAQHRTPATERPARAIAVRHPSRAVPRPHAPPARAWPSHVLRHPIAGRERRCGVLHSVALAHAHFVTI